MFSVRLYEILNGDFEFLVCKLYTNVQPTTMVLSFLRMNSPKPQILPLAQAPSLSLMMTKSVGDVAKTISKSPSKLKGLLAQSILTTQASSWKLPDAVKINAMTEDEKSKELNRLLEEVIGASITFEAAKFKLAQSGFRTLDTIVAILKVFPNYGPIVYSSIVYSSVHGRMCENSHGEC